MNNANPEGETRAARKQRTRAAILAAARHRFITAGYAGTTIRDVANAAGVAVGTIHAHFTDKPALLLACFHAGIAEAVDLAWDTLDESAPLLDQLVHCARVLYAHYTRDLALSREMFTASLFAPLDPDTPDLAGPFLQGLVERYELALARGEIERLPEDRLIVARSFFANYLLILIGGLAGHFEAPADAEAADAEPDRAERWAAALRELLELQLEGLGAQLDDEFDRPFEHEQDPPCPPSPES